MITRDELRELAGIESRHPAAVSFYFQPQTPQNKSHREEAILVKDLVRDALRQAERNGGDGAVRQDLERILARAEQLHGNHARAKVIFACGEHGIWREWDLPPRLRATQLFVNSRFHLAPLATYLDAYERRCCVALLDRERARIFDYHDDRVTERAAILDNVPRRVRSDGFAGYEAGRRERHVDNEAMRHFKSVAEQLHAQLLAGSFERLIVGCRDETWPEFEAHLHADLRQRLIGRFHVDPAVAGEAEVRENAARLLAEHRAGEQHALVREVIGEASRNGRGSIGLRHVLSSLERGEVQALLLGEHFAASVAECRNCGHLDTRMVRSCAVCGQPTRELTDVTDALVVRAVQSGVEVVLVRDDEDFERAGNIGALLRFRADQNTAQKVAG